jgi:hypothetical protein
LGQARHLLRPPMLLLLQAVDELVAGRHRSGKLGHHHGALVARTLRLLRLLRKIRQPRVAVRLMHPVAA